MGRPFLAPPGIPAERVEALRQAFTATMTDPAFMADAEKSQLEVNPVAGDDLQTLVAEIYRTPPEVAKKAAQLLVAKGNFLSRTVARLRASETRERRCHSDRAVPAFSALN